MAAEEEEEVAAERRRAEEEERGAGRGETEREASRISSRRARARARVSPRSVRTLDRSRTPPAVADPRPRTTAGSHPSTPISAQIRQIRHRMRLRRTRHRMRLRRMRREKTRRRRRRSIGPIPSAVDRSARLDPPAIPSAVDRSARWTHRRVRRARRGHVLGRAVLVAAQGARVRVGRVVVRWGSFRRRRRRPGSRGRATDAAGGGGRRGCGV